MFGIKGGFNSPRMLIKTDNKNYKENLVSSAGFNAGLVVELPMGKTMSFEPGLMISSKGVRTRPENHVTTALNLIYLDIPLNLKANIYINNSKMFLLFGPYIGIGLNGKIVCLKCDPKEKEDIKFGSDYDDDLKGSEGGLNLGLGFDILPIQAGLTYSLGLSNISPSSTNGEKVKNRVLSIFVTIRFGDKKKKTKNEIPQTTNNKEKL